MTCNHKWQDEYYGTRCTNCNLFYAHGCGPWDYDENSQELDDEVLQYDEDWDECRYHPETNSCGLVGTEHCDFDCKTRRMLEQ